MSFQSLDFLQSKVKNNYELIFFSYKKNYNFFTILQQPSVNVVLYSKTVPDSSLLIVLYFPGPSLVMIYFDDGTPSIGTLYSVSSSNLPDVVILTSWPKLSVTFYQKLNKIKLKKRRAQASCNCRSPLWFTCSLPVHFRIISGLLNPFHTVGKNENFALTQMSQNPQKLARISYF